MDRPAIKFICILIVLRDPNDREAIVRTAALAAVSEANNAKHCELAMHPASHQEKSIAARRSYNSLNIVIAIP